MALLRHICQCHGYIGVALFHKAQGPVWLSIDRTAKAFSKETHHTRTQRSNGRHHHSNHDTSQWVQYGPCGGTRAECAQSQHQTTLDTDGQVEPSGAQSSMYPVHLAIRRGQTQSPEGRRNHHRTTSRETSVDARQPCQRYVLCSLVSKKIPQSTSG